MSLYDLAVWCDQTTLIQAIHDSTLLFPAIMAAHVVGLAWLGATIAAVDLRLLGVGFREHSAAALARDLRGWMWGGLALTIGSGVLLFASEALRCYESPLFWIKMSLLVSALLFAATIRRSQLRDDGPPPRYERTAGAVSLALWFGVALMGRGIGFW